MGLCTGLFAAAAVAVAPSLSILVPVATQIVLMAFRTGAYVAALGDKLYNNCGKTECWTYVVPGATQLSSQVVVEQFNESRVGILFFIPSVLSDIYPGPYQNEPCIY